MKIKIREIFISWRKGKGVPRNLIGVIKRTSNNGITFRYLKEGVRKAKLEGFNEYPGFPIDFDKEYHEDDLDIFSLRLIPFDRKDNLQLLKFWEATDINDKFSLLALTQGLMPTDNFEFLGLFYPSNNIKFVTDLAGLSHLSLEKGAVFIGDILSYEKEADSKAYKGIAIKVFKSNQHIGYIKNVHNNFFINTERKIKLVVKALEQNGIVKNIFVSVECI